MKKIRIIKPIMVNGEHTKANEVVEVHDVVAAELIGRGSAESLSGKPEAKVMSTKSKAGGNKKP